MSYLYHDNIQLAFYVTGIIILVLVNRPQHRADYYVMCSTYQATYYTNIPKWSFFLLCDI